MGENKVTFRKKQTQKPKAAEGEASKDGWKQNSTLSLSLSPPLSHLSHLSVCLLSVCLPEKVTFSYTGGKEKVSHPEWPSVRRDLPSGHIGADRQTDRATEEGRGGTKTGRREGQLTRRSATSWSSWSPWGL